MEGFALFVFAFAFANAATYLLCERRNRAQWAREVTYTHGERDPGAGYRGDGPQRLDRAYRGPSLDPRAPLGVRAVAMWSIGLGQMLVPGAIYALVGLYFYGVGALGIPGCLLAGRIWAIGPALLRADPRAVDQTRSIARFAVKLNVLVVAVALGLLFTQDMAGLGVFTLVYAGVSLAHAKALRWAGDQLEALWCERGYAAEGLPLLNLPRRSVIDARRAPTG